MDRPPAPHNFVQASHETNALSDYLPGFGNDFETETLPSALPQGMNSPQKCNYGLYGEQLSGSAFTVPSTQNERTWCYRSRPSVKHSRRYKRIELSNWKTEPHIEENVTTLGQYRWDPIPHSTQELTWLTGIHTMTTAGGINRQAWQAISILSRPQRRIPISNRLTQN